jgi:hypothetical protein
MTTASTSMAAAPYQELATAPEEWQGLHGAQICPFGCWRTVS